MTRAHDEPSRRRGPVRIDRVITKGGDLGETSLGDGTRVRKDAARIEAGGTIDEANAVIGVVAAVLAPDSDASSFLRDVQNGLFDLGADLCFPAENEKATRLRFDARLRERLEEETARLNAGLPPLSSFILPGGSPAAAHAHVARTVVRRAERRVVALAAEANVNPEIIVTLNRLSDFLFVLARHLNDEGASDRLWTARTR